ncbi:MAG: SUMF1/EgtB/PvdO family nonheme iron enzyme [Verrucomicrobiota bacterium]
MKSKILALFLRLLTIVVFVELSTHDVIAGQRVALVVGCSKYANLPSNMQLISPAADSADVAAALKAMGYTIVGGGAVKDPTREEFTTAAERFASAARGAEAAVFYYSGHGIQVGEDNYLLPVDTPKITGISQLKNRAVLLRDAFMVALEEAKVPTKVVVLDCCRDNPFASQLEAVMAQVGKSIKTKSVGEITGYGPGFYLAFATSPGQTAFDGNGRRNSPFTTAFLKSLETSSNKDIDLFFRDVKKVMPPDQVSWTNSSLTDEFALGLQTVALKKADPAAQQAEVERRARELALQMTAEKGQEKASGLQKGAVMEGREAGQVYENSLASRFRWCPPGEFVMGSASLEQAAIKQWWNGSDEKQHPVELTRGFWLAEHEVTQAEWKTVMRRSIRDEVVAMLNDAQKFNFGAGKMVTVRELVGANTGDDPVKHMGVESDDMPIYWVSWEQAAEYCQRLTERERIAGRLPAGWRYALPTEAQWEYACRAGTSSTVYTGAVKFLGKNNAPALDNIAWYGGNSSVNYTGRGWNTSGVTERQYTGATGGPRRVGTKGANPWGLQDMIGNVDEWCSDWYEEDISNRTFDPVGPASGVLRVFRGGSWNNSAARCRAAFRCRLVPSVRADFVGFRPALVPSS